MKNFLDKALRIFYIIVTVTIFSFGIIGLIMSISAVLTGIVGENSTLKLITCSVFCAICSFIIGYGIYKLFFEKEGKCKQDNSLNNHIAMYNMLEQKVENCETDEQFEEALKEITKEYFSEDAFMYSVLKQRLYEKEDRKMCNETDFYLNHENCVNRLYNEYKKYGKLIIAVDFDDTIFDFHKLNRKYDRVIDLLKRFENYADIVIFSNKEEKDYGVLESYLKEIGLKYKGINIDVLPNMKGRKMYANAYLDDRAGLKESFSILEDVLEKIED